MHTSKHSISIIPLLQTSVHHVKSPHWKELDVRNLR
jgi:hypothetical protein